MQSKVAPRAAAEPGAQVLIPNPAVHPVWLDPRIPKVFSNLWLDVDLPALSESANWKHSYTCGKGSLCSQEWDRWIPILRAPLVQRRARCSALPALLTLHEPDGGGLEFFTLAPGSFRVLWAGALHGFPTALLCSGAARCWTCQLCKAGLGWEGQRKTTQPSAAAHPETICCFIAG